MGNIVKITVTNVHRELQDNTWSVGPGELIEIISKALSDNYVGFDMIRVKTKEEAEN